MIRVFVLPAALMLVGVACGTDEGGDAETGASVAIKAPASGTTVEGNVVILDLEANGIGIVKADGDGSGKTGHYHVFIDRDPVAAGQAIPKEPGIVHSAADPTELSGLAVGEHRLTVVVGDGNHVRIGDAQATMNVTVKGPSIDAKAPATLTAGEALKIDVTVDGVQLVKADGDSSGRTGHLHVLVQAAPPVAGEVIPPASATIIHSAETSIEVPGLAAGEQTLWVVLGDGNHTPFDPPVRDKLVVTVS